MSEPHETRVLSRSWLTEDTFEIRFSRPPLFQFVPGQRVRFIRGEIERDYTPVSSPRDGTLDFLVRSVKGGRFSSTLASAQEGDLFRFSGPHGYFCFYPSKRLPVFVATGTGVAPFASMARAGVKGFILLHGVRRFLDLYAEPLFRRTARLYVPCLSGLKDEGELAADVFAGRVSAYLESRLPEGAYDFYLCGRGEMIRDVIHIVDRRFRDSLVYTEPFA
ncbi:MAG: FAD-binding oxidoreductase [Desulfobacterota bacterium]|nr:FAD-binding oxidoreductase [Thermodesulfobacteriota bacterium]